MYISVGERNMTRKSEDSSIMKANLL